MRKKRGSKWTPEQRRKFKATLAARKAAGTQEFPLDAIPARPSKPVPELMRKLTRMNILEHENKLLRELVQHYMRKG